MQVVSQQTYSVTDYLNQEYSSDTRHEFINGVIRSMAGGKPNHNQVVGNLYAHLNFALKHRPYRAFVTDQRLWIPHRNIYTYPDVMVVAEPLQLQEGRQDTLLNPIVIAEVLSDATRSYDKGEKFTAYGTIETLQEYILLEPEQMLVLHYIRQENDRWNYAEYRNPAAMLEFKFLPLELSLGDLYDKVDANLNSEIR